jgi:Bacteriocin-protection, YdeI or OmpD-Associated/Domain of unknown function (DUF1905)
MPNAALPAGPGSLRQSGPLGQDGCMGVVHFKTQLQPRGPAAAVILDDAQVAAVGEGAKRFPVVATVNGYTWRTTVVRMGGEFLLGLSKEVRQGAGAEAGDEVDVTVELDTAPREVEVPEALAAALAADPEAKASFDRMAFTHRKEYARWIADAKQEQTRQRRLGQALEMIRAGKTRS